MAPYHFLGRRKHGFWAVGGNSEAVGRRLLSGGKLGRSVAISNFSVPLSLSLSFSWYGWVEANAELWGMRGLRSGYCVLSCTLGVLKGECSRLQWGKCVDPKSRKMSNKQCIHTHTNTLARTIHFTRKQCNEQQQRDK